MDIPFIHALGFVANSFTKFMNNLAARENL